jgi:dihydrofolate reductase
MAQLTMTAFVSLDGVMQAPGGPEEDPEGGFQHGGWVFPYSDEFFGAEIVKFFANADAFLLGRRTYDIFAAYWPAVTDPQDPIAGPLNALPKHVASRSARPLAWDNSRLLHDPVREVPALKAQYARELQVHGSADLLQTLIAQRLIDEYRLFIFPVTLGRGKKLFASGTVPVAYELVRSAASREGVMLAVYRPAGEVRTGTFARE